VDGEPHSERQRKEQSCILHPEKSHRNPLRKRVRIGRPRWETSRSAYFAAPARRKTRTAGDTQKDRKLKKCGDNSIHVAK
jgi:hypothetical protein